MRNWGGRLGGDYFLEERRKIGILHYKANLKQIWKNSVKVVASGVGLT